MKPLSDFKMDNRGSIYIWMIALITIIISGIVLIGMVEIDAVLYPLGADLGVPEAQRHFMHDMVTRGFPLGVIFVTLLWAWTKAQKKAGGDVY